jgi:hypothetical protein
VAESSTRCTIRLNTAPKRPISSVRPTSTRHATSPFAIASAAFVSSVSGRTRRRVAIHERNAPAAAKRNASVPRTRSDAVCFARMPLSGCSIETESGVPRTGALALNIVPTLGRSTRPRLSNSSRCRSGAETGSPVNCTQFEPAASWM